MTIKELREIMSKYPDDYKVVIAQDGYPNGFPTIASIWNEDKQWALDKRPMEFVIEPEQ